MTPPPLTPDDAKAMAARIGIMSLTAHDLERLAALTANTDEQLAKLPVMPKAVPPANVFGVPQPKD